ncbi:MAG: hypothetical protein GF320_04050, partial [Armatimonadia bacterium]|nr:hypothetical protein [Armatimonadia bacterium]
MDRVPPTSVGLGVGRRPMPPIQAGGRCFLPPGRSTGWDQSMYSQPKPSFVQMTPRGEYRLADMYQAPPAYGAPPEGLEWDPEDERLALRWAEDGGPTKDPWVWSAEGGLSRLASASDFPPHPREDDDRSDKEREHAERMNPGVTAATWSKRGGSLYFLCRGDLYRIDGDGEHRTLIHGSGDVSGLTAIPGSDDVSFMWKGSLWRSRGDGLRRLTYVTKTDHDVVRHEWSRSGDRVAVVVQDKSSWDRVKMPDYTPEDEVKINELRRNNVGGPLAKMRVATVGAEGGLLETVPIEMAGDGPVDQGSGEQFVLHDLCWTSGGGLLIAYVGPWYRDFCLALYRPGDDDRPRVIHRETAEPWFPHSRIGVGADPEAAYLTSPRDGWLRLYRVPLDGSPLEAVSRPGCDVARFEVAPEGESVVYTAFTPDPRDQSLIRVGPGGEDEAVLIEGAGSCDFRASDDGSALAAQVSAVMEPPKLLALSPAGERTEILRTETDRFADVPKPRVDRFKMPFSFSKRP